MTDLQIPPGVSRGATPSERPGRWYDSNLVRWRDGRLMPVAGWDRLSPTASTSPIRGLFAARDNTDIPRIFIGTDSGLTVLEGSAFSVITPTGFVGLDGAGASYGWGVGPFGGEAWGTARTLGATVFNRAGQWTFSSYGGDVLAMCSSDGRLLRWSAAAPTTPVTVVTGAPTACRAMTLTAERHVVVVGPGGLPRRVAWSDRENAAGWDYTSLTGQAGFIDLLDTPGVIQTVVGCRDGSLLMTDSTVDLLRYVGAPLYYGVERVGTGTSLLSPNAVAHYGGVVMWLGETGFWAYDGGVAKQVPSEISSAVYSNDPIYGIDLSYSRQYAFAAHNGLYNEIWFHYCSTGSTVPNRTVVYNYAENWWSLHSTLSRTAMTPAGVWPRPVFAGSDGHVYEMEADNWLAAGSSRIGTVYVETAAVVPGGQALALRGQMDSGTGDPTATAVTVYARQTHEGPEITFGPYVPLASGYLPMRAGGADLRLRVAGTQDANFSIGKMSFDVAPVGRR